MRLTTDEALQEVLKKSETIRKKREKRKVQLLSGAVALLFAGLILTISQYAGGGAAQSTETSYGAFLLSAEVGGYILVALIAFAAGVILTMILQKYRWDMEDKKKD